MSRPCSLRMMTPSSGMKYAVSALCAALFFPLLCHGALTPEQQKQLLQDYYNHSPYFFDPRVLTEDEKQYLISIAHERIAKDPSEYEGRQLDSPANMLLTILSDKGLIKRAIAYYRERGMNGETLCRTYNPEIIFKLSGELFIADPWPIPPASEPFVDQPVLPRSYRVYQVIETLLAESPSFSTAVNEWAKRNFSYDANRRSISLLEHRTLLREWWKQNGRFFKAKNYKAVKTGAELFESHPSKDGKQKP